MIINDDDDDDDDERLTTWADVIFRVGERWLPLWLLKNQSPITVLLRTSLTQTITFYKHSNPLCPALSYLHQLLPRLEKGKGLEESALH